jgi:hypothetical protein
MSFDGEQLIMQLGPVLPVTESHEALSAADGSFVLEDLMEGDWAIRAVMEDPDSGAQRQAASETVHVGRQGAPEPELRLQRSFEMTVTLDWGETPPASGLVHFTFQGANGPAVAEQAEPPTVGKAPLALRYRNVTPGYYQLSATLTGIPNSHYLAAVKQGGRDVLGQPILLAPTSAPLSIVMKPSPGAIAATVEVLKDRVRPAVVLLWKAGPPMGESDWVRMAAASTEGRAAFGGLAPGPYNLAAFDRTELQQITATLLNSLAPTAKRVEVVAGANTPVELKAQRWPE